MEDTESLSNSLHDLAITPTHTSIPDSESCAEVGSEQPSITPKTGPPFDGATFIIRDPQTGLVITLVGGRLTLLSGYNDLLDNCRDGRGSHWRCVESQGRWLGFKNTVSGQFIGQYFENGEWHFWAKDEFHTSLQFFCTRHYWLSGGYEMLVKHGDGFRAMKIGGPDKTKLVVGEEGERGTAWEFLEVEHPVTDAF
ncbi:hypothetical protein N7509_007765 [Penicillium cosmopolitanum]|uniref:Uncharacterized protein n=1 Tax=Penicillium cosmopolitanum TaxID=1131564 RepID=A0A9W9VZP4_9EURO|nr:uncharacterized protein N7509_007765 [Penicillium cosmopolitanum]KAJ5392275.1 hypothetical protein N7509_007765 [Penicillium cosmopolitanum]